MPILLFALLVVLIAQIGFWDTFGAILGGFAMIVLLIVMVGAIVALGGFLLARRVKRDRVVQRPHDPELPPRR